MQIVFTCCTGRKARIGAWLATRNFGIYKLTFHAERDLNGEAPNDWKVVASRTMTLVEDSRVAHFIRGVFALLDALEAEDDGQTLNALMKETNQS